MTLHVAINGFGRMGRLGLRAAWGFDPMEPDSFNTPRGGWGEGAYDIVRINEANANAATNAHLLAFDSVHGRWPIPVQAEGQTINVGGRNIECTQNSALTDSDWSDIDIVVECSGKFRSVEALQPYFDAGVKKVIVSAPVKDDRALNIVVGVNDHLYDPDKHHLVTAASCTTNCLAPVVKVVHETFGIRHGMITTVHDVTNTQSVVDKPHKDLRRARSSLTNLIPTSTGSATAIGLIFPELQGKLDGIAVRVPLLNASLTDCVFEVEQATTAEAVNDAFRQAAGGDLKGILAAEDRPLVSADFRGDTNSSIVDCLSTKIVGGTQVKIFAWYDNEIGYVHRMMELTNIVARGLGRTARKAAE